MRSEEVLALITDLRLTKSQYKLMRINSKHKNVYPPYNKISEGKARIDFENKRIIIIKKRTEDKLQNKKIRILNA